MTDSQLDPIIERIAHDARRPVAVNAGARDRLIAAVHAEPLPDRDRIAAEEPVTPSRRSVTLSVARFAALAAGLVGIGALVGISVGRAGQATGQPQVVAAIPRRPASASTDTVVTFVFVAPRATRVAVVGDFNQWNGDATPMRRIENSNAWTVTVPISAGRHTYSFLAVDRDGEKYVADPYAPTADDGFGRVNSVVLVGKRPAS